MNRLVYNVSMAAGLALFGAGIGLEHGLGYGLAVAGALLIVLTMFGAYVASRSA